MLISDTQYFSWQKKLSDNKFFRRFWVFWAIYSALLYVAMGGYFFSLHFGWKIVALGIFSALFVRYTVCEVIHYFYKKQHPYQRLGFSPPTSKLFSFKDSRPDAWPSEHAAFFAATIPVIWYFSVPLGIAAVAIVVIMSFGRIIVGYHEPEDVLAGWIIGAIVGLLFVYFIIPIIFK